MLIEQHQNFLKPFALRVLYIKFETLGSPRVLKTLCLDYTCRIQNKFYLEVGHRGSIIIKTKE